MIEQVPDHIMDPEAQRAPDPAVAGYAGEQAVAASVEGGNPYEKLFNNPAPAVDRQPSPNARSAEEIKRDNERAAKNADLIQRYGSAYFNVK
jgi:hypothetical protein